MQLYLRKEYISLPSNHVSRWSLHYPVLLFKYMYISFTKFLFYQRNNLKSLYPRINTTSISETDMLNILLTSLKDQL